MQTMRPIRFNRHTLFSTILNIAGLTLAFSVFMTVMVQVLYDLRYDRCYPGHEKIYRLESTPPGGTGEFFPVVSRPMIEYLKTAVPQAEAVGTYQYMKGRSELFNETGSDNTGVNLRFGNSDHDLLRVFPFRFISGDTTDYGAPRTAVISAKGAARLFGDKSPIGREISFTTYSDPRPYRIVAVYEDFPDNSTIDNELLLSLGIDGMDNWSNWSLGCFLRLSTYEGAQAAADSAASFIGNEVFQVGGVNFRLTSLHDAHWSRDISSDSIAKGNLATTLVLLTVALIMEADDSSIGTYRPGICPQYRSHVHDLYLRHRILHFRIPENPGQSATCRHDFMHRRCSRIDRRHFPRPIQYFVQPGDCTQRLVFPVRTRTQAPHNTHRHPVRHIIYSDTVLHVHCSTERLHEEL